MESVHVPVFSAHLRTVRYCRPELMATTRSEKKQRLPADVRSEVMRLASEGMSMQRIVVEIAKLKRLLISFEAAQRGARKTGRYQARAGRLRSDQNSV